MHIALNIAFESGDYKNREQTQHNNSIFIWGSACHAVLLLFSNKGIGMLFTNLSFAGSVIREQYFSPSVRLSGEMANFGQTPSKQISAHTAHTMLS